MRVVHVGLTIILTAMVGGYRRQRHEGTGHLAEEAHSKLELDPSCAGLRPRWYPPGNSSDSTLILALIIAMVSFASPSRNPLLLCSSEGDRSSLGAVGLFLKADGLSDGGAQLSTVFPLRRSRPKALFLEHSLFSSQTGLLTRRHDIRSISMSMGPK
jgi:hypothetical protein